jgi:hypothetical protein
MEGVGSRGEVVRVNTGGAERKNLLTPEIPTGGPEMPTASGATHLLSPLLKLREIRRELKRSLRSEGGGKTSHLWDGNYSSLGFTPRKSAPKCARRVPVPNFPQLGFRSERPIPHEDRTLRIGTYTPNRS